MRRQIRQPPQDATEEDKGLKRLNKRQLNSNYDVFLKTSGLEKWLVLDPSFICARPFAENGINDSTKVEVVVGGKNFCFFQISKFKHGVASTFTVVLPLRPVHRDCQWLFSIQTLVTLKNNMN